MAKSKRITNPAPIESFDSPWGGTYHTGDEQPVEGTVMKEGEEWGHTHAEVERVIKEKSTEVKAELTFLKEKLQEALQNGNKKFGSIIVTTDESQLTTVRFFSDDNAASEWESDPLSNDRLVLETMTLQGAGQSSEYTMVARIIHSLNSVQVAGADNIFTFSFSSYYGNDPSDLDTQPGIAVLIVNGTEVSRLTLDSNVSQYSFNVGKYLTEEINTVRIVVSNAHGKSRSWDYRVEVKSLDIAFTQSYLSTQHIAKTGGWPLPILVSGVGGTVYVKVDGDTLEYEQDVDGGQEHSFFIDSDNRLQRGTHHIEVWCEDKVYGLKSAHIKTSYIVASDSPGIAVGANAPVEAPVYDTVLIPYYVYAPVDDSGTTLDTVVTIVDNNGAEIETKHQTLTIDSAHSSGLQYAAVQIMDNSYAGKTLTVKFSIGNGSASIIASHAINVSASDISLREATECVVHYNMSGKTNSDDDVATNTMSSSYRGSQTSRLLRSENFVLSEQNGCQSGGFVIPAQKHLTLKDWKPFATDFGVNGQKGGKSIEMEISVGVASDMDKPVVSCMDSRCGFKIFPTRIEVKYSSSDERIVTYFPDGERIKFSLVINGTATNCVNDDGNGNREENLRNLGFIYVNGVMVRIFDYARSTWLQQNVCEIVFGSDESELTLYSFRGYDKALTMKEVIDNFSYDTPLLSDKLAIAKRNNILESDGVTVSRTLVESALPNTPIINWWMEKLPANKKDPRECKQTDFTNPEWNENEGAACAPFTASSHEINGDGTSSNAYPLPYKNWAEKFKDYGGDSQGIITLHLTESNETVKKYSITYGVDGGETKFVHKVNFASSEGIFNILAMNMYHQITLGAYSQINDLLSLQQQRQVDAGKAVTFRKSLSGFPEIGFRTYTNSNGQKVTKFLSIYNFINNKKTGSMFGMVEDYRVNQLWEVDENVNFFNTLMTEHSVGENERLVESNGVRDSSPFYYSRYPDESPENKQDGGKACDLGLPVNAAQVAQANDEIRALRHIHNWIVSVNPNVAERYKAKEGSYRRFTVADDGFESKTYGNITFTSDTPSYRIQKFIAECDDHLYINDCIFYFLFCTYILGMDSMDKNMSLFLDTVEDFYSDDPSVRASAKVKLRIMLRDTDSICLFNNTGVLTYKYWHEWNDTYNSGTGETGQITGETYDTETRTYSIATNVAGSSPVFNGRLSGLWDALSNSVPLQIKTIYRVMRNAGLNYQSFMGLYEHFRSYWCEALYNVDGLGYANTGNFIMAYGDKLMVSKYFFKYRERYMDSKYGYILDSHQVTLRLSSVPNGIWMKHFTPIYASFTYGGNTPTTTRSIHVGEAALLPCTANSFNDATCYINNADFVTEIGTYTMTAGGTPQLNGWEGMENFHFTLNFGRMVRLRKFIWANSPSRPNTEQTVDNGNIEFVNLKMLKELVMTYCTHWAGSPVIGSDIIEKIDFRGTPIVGITLPETGTLEELYLPETLKVLRLVNLPNLKDFDISGVDDIVELEVRNAGAAEGLGLVRRIYNRNQGGHTVNLYKVTLDNLDITISDSNMLDTLLWIAGMNGSRVSGHIQLSNNIDLTYMQKRDLVTAFGNIDDPKNGLYVTYRYNIDTLMNVEIFCNGISDIVTNEGNYQLEGIPMSGGSESKYANYISGQEWSINNPNYATIDAKTGLLTVHTIGTNEGDTAVVTLRSTLLDGTELTKSLTLHFYARDAELGDYVYADGSYSRTWLDVKTCVGIVFINENGVKEVCGLTYINNMCWGLFSTDVSGVTTDGSTSAYDTSVTNIASMPFSAKDTATAYFNISEDKFVANPASIAEMQLVHIPEADVTVSGLVESVSFERGRPYAQGYKNTIDLIVWRNKILSYAKLGIPKDTVNETEMQCLQRLMAEITVAEGHSKYTEYYYPAASACYAYQPAIRAYESLATQFKTHKWFLPASGELGRIIFYWTRNDTSGTSRYDAFKSAKARGAIRIDGRIWSSTENGASNAYLANPDGTIRCTQSTMPEGTYYYKRNGNVNVIPVCAL